MPFGPYQDFAECVADNGDKANPEAYCSELHHQITGRWPGEKSLSEYQEIALAWKQGEGLTPEQIAGLCERFGGEEGFHTRCTGSDGIQQAFGQGADRFCAWLKDQCHPGWRETDEGEDDVERDVAAKSVIGSHSTEVVNRAWSAASVERGIPDDASARDLRSIYAWRDPDGEPTAKSSYKFPHHHGVGGPANIRALRAGIAALNGARGGADIPADEKRGVYNHLAKHLRDADIEPPALRDEEGEDIAMAQKRTGVMIGLWPDATVAQALALNAEGAEPADQLHLTLAFVGDVTELSIEALQALPHLVHEWAAMAFPVEGRISGIGRFSTGEDLHPVYASVDIPGIHSLRDSLVSYLRMAGIPVHQDFEFSPHITLQYVEAGSRNPVDAVHPHQVHFEKVSLAIAGDRRDYFLGMPDEDVEVSMVGGPFFASAGKAEADKEHDGTEHIAYAAVLVPGEPDSDGEVLSPVDIERVAHLWMEQYQNVDIQHTLNNVDVRPVESYVTTEEKAVRIGDVETTLPAGTWVMAGKARDEGVWEGIKNGQLAGYSVMAVPGMSVKSALKSEGGNEPTEGAKKARTLIRDLGPGWIVPFVSVVDRPAVPKARWFAFKSAFDPDTEQLLESVPEESRGWVGAVLAEGRKMSEATYRQLRTAVAKMAAQGAEAQEDEMTEQEIRDLVQSTVGEAVKAEVAEAVKTALGEKPLAEQIADAVKAAMPEPDASAKNGEGEGSGEGEGAGDGAGDQSGEGDESEAMKAMREEIEALKAKVEEGEEFKAELEKRLSTRAAKSRSLPGQDGGNGDEPRGGAEPEIVTSYGLKYRRDGFGRSVPVK